MTLPGYGQAKSLLSRLLAVKSARGVSFTISVVSMSSKPLGYLRTLITAWVFGTSPGMDSFHMACSIVSLFAGTIGSSMESAVLPELVRVKERSGEEACRNLYAVVACIVIFLASFLCAALAIAPGVLVRFFASGFDAERIRIGAVMLWWLMPFAVVTMGKPLLDVWAMLGERYTLSCITASVFNFVAIPALLAGMQIIGVYSVAMSMSAGHVAASLLLVIGLKGIPLCWRKGEVLWSSIATIARNSTFTLVIVGASTIFMVVDRYFASRLPSGSVAAISYGGSIMSVVIAAASAPMVFFLTRISKAAAQDAVEAERMLRQAIAIMTAYVLPAGLFMAASAGSIISVVYGWGSFGRESVQMTSTAFSAYALGIVFILNVTLLHRYAQARQRLGVMVLLTYCMVFTNAVLDWAMVGRWGIGGLALATSITQAVSFVVYYRMTLGGSIMKFFAEIRFYQQLLAVCICAFIVWRSSPLGSVWQLAIFFVTALLYLFSADRFGLMPGVPEHWRPVKLAGFIRSSVRSFVK